MGVIIGSVVFALALLWGGKGDYEEAVKQHETYCRLVSEGVWPDYDRRDCTNTVYGKPDKPVSF